MLGYLEVRQRFTKRSSLSCLGLSKYFRVLDMVVSVVSKDSVVRTLVLWNQWWSKEIVEWIKIDMSNIVKGFIIKYSSFVNQTSALNISITEEELSLHFKNQSIASGFHLSQIQVKSNKVKWRNGHVLILHDTWIIL